MFQRLDKFVSSQGLLSRREAAQRIRNGRVIVDGIPCRDPAAKIDGAAADVALDGAMLCYKPFLYVMLNKPAGLLCVSRDPTRPTVVDRLPAPLRRPGMFPAGRLDKDTVGLVILTNDGAYAHRLLSPREEIAKTYEAVLDGPVTPQMIDAFAAGTSLPDGTPCRPAVLTLLRDDPTPLVRIRITEGKYHQIKRMFGTHGRGVLFLKRLSIGNLWMDDDWKEGECREMTAEEVRLSLEAGA